MANNNNKNKNSVAKRGRSNHLFTGCRDAITYVAGQSSTPGTAAYYLTTSTGGNVSYGTSLSPMGLGAATYSSSTYAGAIQGNVANPLLRGLYNRSQDFQWYRVLRAKFVFVGSVGSTTSGTITLAGYADPGDVSNPTIQGLTSGPGTRTFDLSNSATRELSVPIPVDTAWKKCSWVLSQPGAAPPFTGSSTSTIVPLSTVSALCFAGVSLSVTGAPASTTMGFMYIDYDVEFKTPIEPTLNN